MASKNKSKRYFCAILQPEKHYDDTSPTYFSFSLRKQNHNFVRKIYVVLVLQTHPKKDKPSVEPWKNSSTANISPTQNAIRQS